MLLVTFCWQHVSVTVANNLRVAVFPSPNEGVFSQRGYLPNTAKYLYLTLIFMLHHYVHAFCHG